MPFSLRNHVRFIQDWVRRHVYWDEIPAIDQGEQVIGSVSIGADPNAALFNSHVAESMNMDSTGDKVRTSLGSRLKEIKGIQLDGQDWPLLAHKPIRLPLHSASCSFIRSACLLMSLRLFRARKPAQKPTPTKNQFGTFAGASNAPHG